MAWNYWIQAHRVFHSSKFYVLFLPWIYVARSRNFSKCQLFIKNLFKFSNINVFIKCGKLVWNQKYKYQNDVINVILVPSLLPLLQTSNVSLHTWFYRTVSKIIWKYVEFRKHAEKDHLCFYKISINQTLTFISSKIDYFNNSYIKYNTFGKRSFNRH